MNFSELIFCLVLLLFFSCKDGPTLPHPISGYYDNNLLIAYDPISAEISGLFYPQTQYGDSCYIYFAAKFTQDKVNSIGWHPRKKKDGLTFGIFQAHEGNTFDLYFEKPINNCNEFNFSDLPGKRFKLSKEMNWQRIWTVKKISSPVFSQPDTSSSHVIELNTHDIVKVVENDIFWVRIQTGPNDEIDGWIEKKYLKRFPG